MTYEQVKTELEQIRQIPYPEITGIQKDVVYANKLLNDFAGNMSEMTAVNLYIYQHLAISTKNNTVNNIMLEVAKVEMQHLEKIGTLIKHLGLDPYYMNSLGKQWTSENIYYHTQDIVKTMQYNIKAEKMAIESYMEDREYSSNKSIQELFDRIILDEQTHIRIFNEIANEYMNYNG